MDDDVADNERADRALDARINYQNERLEDYDTAEQGRRDRANKPRASAAPKVPQSEGALYADIRRRFNKGEEITDRERQFARDFEARKNRQPSRGGGAKASGYAGGGGGAPVKVKSIEEARKLPKGTMFLAPDGKVRVR